MLFICGRSQLCGREAELKKNLKDFLSYVSGIYLSALVQKLALALECGQHSFSIANTAIYYQLGGLKQHKHMQVSKG